MTEPNAYGLVDLGMRWAPRSMLKGEGAVELMTVVVESTADALNPLMMFERYISIMLAPSRCDDAELNRILALNGVSADSLTAEQSRRLAVLAPSLREWRGAFFALRSVIQALSGGPVVIRSWVVQRTVVDESTWGITLMDPEEESGRTDVFALTGFDDEVARRFIDDYAKTATDVIDLVKCFVSTSWRAGYADWTATGLPSLVASSINGEFECLRIGPDIDATVQQVMTAGSQHASTDTRLRLTMFYSTTDATSGDVWYVWMMHSSDLSEGYEFRIGVGMVSSIELFRVDAGTPTSIGSWVFDLPDGPGYYRRLDFEIEITSSSSALFRVSVDGDAGVLISDSGTSKTDTRTSFGLDTSVFTTGSISVAAVVGHVFGV